MNFTLFVLFIGIVFFVSNSNCSSHSEAPGTAKNPVADISDLYMFRSYETGKEDHIVFLMNVYPIQTPYGGPNYFSLSEDHFYEICIDNDGDGVEDIIFQWLYQTRLGGEMGTFEELDEDHCANATLENVTKHGGIELNIGGESVPIPLKFVGPISRATENQTANWFEFYELYKYDGDRRTGVKSQVTVTGTGENIMYKPFDYAGTKTFADYETYADSFIYSIDIPGCGSPGRVFVGQRKESFAISLGKIFDLVNLVPVPGFPGAINECPLNDDLRGVNVDVLALEVPISCLVTGGEDVIGAWGQVRELLHDDLGNHIPDTQVSRLGNPLVNEIAIGIRDKRLFNFGEPKDDARFLLYVTNPTLPEILNLLFRDAVNTVLGTNFTTIAPTNFPRNDLIAVFLTGIDGINQPAGVVPSEMLRLNTATPPTPANEQDSGGVINGDGAGYPNGRRPIDDVVDIGLRAMMGRLCKLSIGCVPGDAVVGHVNFTDGVPISIDDFDDTFPFLKTPIPGATSEDFCEDFAAVTGTVIISYVLDPANALSPNYVQGFTSSPALGANSNFFLGGSNPNVWSMEVEVGTYTLWMFLNPVLTITSAVASSFGDFVSTAGSNSATLVVRENEVLTLLVMVK